MFGKNKKNESQSQLQNKKNFLRVTLTNKATDTTAEVTTGSDNSMRSKNTVKVVVNNMITKTNWGSGKYKVACSFSGEETGYDEYDITATVNGDNVDIVFDEDEPTVQERVESFEEAVEEDEEQATTMLEEADEVTDSQEESSTEEGNEESYESYKDYEESSSSEDDYEEEVEEEDEETPEQAAAREENERIRREEAERIRKEQEERARIKAEREAEQKRREAEKAEREAEQKRLKLEKEIGIATTLKPRSKEAIATCFEEVNQRLLALSDEETEVIIPLKERVDNMSFKDYVELKRETFSKDEFIPTKVDRYIEATMGMESIADLELEDPEQAALLLLSFENLKHVMSNLRVLQAVFPGMDERMIRAMNPKNFGLKGKWDDPYEDHA